MFAMIDLFIEKENPMRTNFKIINGVLWSE